MRLVSSRHRIGVEVTERSDKSLFPDLLADSSSKTLTVKLHREKLTMVSLTLIFLSAVVGLAALLPNPAINLQPPTPLLLPFNISSSSPTITPSSSASSSVNFAAETPKCMGPRYGYDLERQSCLDALLSIAPDSTTRHTYGARTRGNFEVQLPYRFLSTDGLCAIDIEVVSGKSSDVSDWAEISEKAQQLVDRCVLLVPNFRHTMGGSIRNVGSDGNLIIVLRSYVADVTCRSYPPYLDGGRCSNLLGTIPVGRKGVEFSRTGISGEGRMIIPEGKTFTESQHVCTATVDLIDQEADSCSWTDLWAGAVAVDRMCVQNGKAGMSFGHGKKGQLTIELGP